jgi:acyl carrier protein
MSEDVVAFAISSLREMNFDMDGAGADSLLGPAGIDLDSLAVAELALRIEDQYGVKFGEDEMERLSIMTLGEFASAVDERTKPTATVGEGTST